MNIFYYIRADLLPAASYPRKNVGGYHVFFIVQKMSDQKFEKSRQEIIFNNLNSLVRSRSFLFPVKAGNFHCLCVSSCSALFLLFLVELGLPLLILVSQFSTFREFKEAKLSLFEVVYCYQKWIFFCNAMRTHFILPKGIISSNENFNFKSFKHFIKLCWRETQIFFVHFFNFDYRTYVLSHETIGQVIEEELFSDEEASEIFPDIVNFQQTEVVHEVGLSFSNMSDFIDYYHKIDYNELLKIIEKRKLELERINIDCKRNLV